MPVSEPARFSPKGPKWLLFLACCICGDFTGHLSLSSTGDAIDYDAPLDATTYHFVSHEQPRFVDPKLIDTRTSDKSAKPRTGAFRDGLIARDHHCLVIDNRPVKKCDAAHLLPHSRGDNYISAATGYRGSDNLEIIESIDDPRNGLLLSTELHIHLGWGDMAFLRTPNPVLGICDVNPSPVPRPGPFSSTRVTVHYLDEDLNDILAFHGYDLRLPNNDDDFHKFPPSLILDMLYASSFVAYRGDQGSIKRIEDEVFSLYYDHDRNEDEDDDEDGSEGEDKDEGGSGTAAFISIDSPQLSASAPNINIDEPNNSRSCGRVSRNPVRCQREASKRPCVGFLYPKERLFGPSISNLYCVWRTRKILGAIYRFESRCKGSGRRGDDSGAETEKDEGVDPNKSKGRLTEYESTDPLLLKGKARGNALENALDFLLLFQKYCVQGAGLTEERLEKEEQAKRRTESIEKVKGWEACSDSTI